MRIRRVSRRQFVLNSLASLGAALLVSARPKGNIFESDTAFAMLQNLNALQFISVRQAAGVAPAGLIVCLHGFGGNAKTLALNARLLNLPSYQMLFPDAPFSHPRLSGGRMWYNLNSSEFQGLAESRQQLAEWLKSLEGTTGIPLSRTVLMGFSQGGAMAQGCGIEIAFGWVGVSEWLLAHERQNSLQAKLSHLFWSCRGIRDTIVPVSAAHGARDSLMALGVPVKYLEFDIGHEISAEVLQATRAFVLEVTK